MNGKAILCCGSILLHGLLLILPISVGVAGEQSPAATACSRNGETPGDGEALTRGKQVFSVNCSFCHGSDARGGEGGPNLLRSPMVLADQHGEVIATVVQNGRQARGMPKFDLSTASVAAIAAFLHSLDGAGDAAWFDPKSILVGNAAAGKAYFNGKGHCVQCHSLKGDLAGIGAKYDPKTLQDNIVSGGFVGMLGAPLPSAPAQAVTVRFSSVVGGALLGIDDFSVSLIDADGNRRTFRRRGDVPYVQVKNPLQRHLDMLREWEDRDIHNLTAFLSTQK